MVLVMLRESGESLPSWIERLAEDGVSAYRVDG
jgi:hypothetical protein